jgi:hypothetical protein
MGEVFAGSPKWTFRGWRENMGRMTAVTRLLGRDEEAKALARLLEGLPRSGGALIVRGEAGIGKSALLSEAADAAVRLGMLVLTATGVQAEANLPFAGLDQLLRPLLARHRVGAAAAENPALTAALQAVETGAPELYLTALATLELLGEAAASTPIVLIAEDAHWIDQASGDVLAFIGRRLQSDPIVLLAAVRDGYDSPLIRAGLPEMRLGGLADGPARALLSARFPALTPAVRDRILEEAAGNPLALEELPLVLPAATDSGKGALPGRLPLTARLERAFAASAAELPAAGLALVRVASADDSSDITEIMHAARIAVREHLTAHDLVPAVKAHLVEIDGTSISFRHPLVRSAVYQAMSIAERQAVHAALAEIPPSLPSWKQRPGGHATAAG